VRQHLRHAADASGRGDVRAIMFSTEIAAGTPLPVTLLVLEPADLRMSPAVGTAPEKVLAVLAEGLRQLDPSAHATMVEVRGPGAAVLRTHRLDAVADGSEAEGTLRLMADYWIPVPDSKQVLLARFSTPLGELENMMCALFDEFVAASYFATDRPPSLREQLRGARR